jgi:Cdc6-like AAA superfamily ATPase
LRESGNIAEDKSVKKIMPEHVKIAISKLDEFSIKEKNELDEECKFVLDIVKSCSDKKIGDLFKIYVDKGGKLTYKSFQRNIQKLADNKFVEVIKIMGGAEGTTTIVNLNSVSSQNEKEGKKKSSSTITLDDFQPAG